MSSIELEQFRKIFVGGLNYQTTEEGLRSYYGQWGELTDCVVMTDRDTGKSRGFGFVTYAHSTMVDEAMSNRSSDSSEPHTLDGRQVQPKRAIARDQAYSPGANSSVTKIFVGGLRDKPITKDDLEVYFGSFGEVKECMMITERDTGRPRGFAFVQFDDYDPVDKITMRKLHTIQGVNIEVRKAIPKDIVATSSRGRGRGSGFTPRGGYGCGPDGGGYGGGGGYNDGYGEGHHRGGGGGYGRGSFGGRGRGGHDGFNSGGSPYHGRNDGFGPMGGCGGCCGNNGGGGNGGGGGNFVSSQGSSQCSSGSYGGSPNMGFQAYGCHSPARPESMSHCNAGAQSNAAYGFGGGWDNGAATSRNSRDDQKPSPSNTVSYQHLGQNYEQGCGGGPMSGRGRGGFGGNKPAGVIGGGRPKPYTGGYGTRNV